MPILKNITAPNGAIVGFHKAMQASVNIGMNSVTVNVASWTSEDDYFAGKGLVWMWAMDTTLAALSDIDAMLSISDPFGGGTIIVDGGGTLAAARLRAWARIKDARDAAIASGFTWNGLVFDSDDVSQQRIQGGVQLASMAAANGQEFSIDWTVADNTTRTLSGVDMIAVGVALGAWVTSNFAAGVALRAQINAATSIDQLAEITWPLAPTP
jgi:hypothetical protein